LGGWRSNPAYVQFAQCERVVGTALSRAFALKSLLRWTFGSIQNHNWLAAAPGHFHGLAVGEDDNGIPSSHMLVLIPLFLASWQYFPRY